MEVVDTNKTGFLSQQAIKVTTEVVFTTDGSNVLCSLVRGVDNILGRGGGGGG